MGQILENGYEMKTTFWMDFTIADSFGVEAIKDTFNRAFNEWQNNVEFVTELAIVMSCKSIYYFGKNEQYMKVYIDLYHIVDDWCMNNFKDDDLLYYLNTTD